MMFSERIQEIAAFVGCLASIAAALALFIKPFRDKIFGMLNIANGLKCTLRSDILNTYYRNLEKNAIRQFEVENLHKTYAAYKALGGNSFIDDLYQEIRTWKVVD